MDVVDFTPTSCLHTDYPTWDHFSLSHASRQIYAETASQRLAYFNTHLIFFPSVVAEWLCIDELELIVDEILSASEERVIKHVALRWDDIGRPMIDDSQELRSVREFVFLERLTMARVQRHTTEKFKKQIKELLRRELGKEDLVVDFRYLPE